MVESCAGCEIAILNIGRCPGRSPVSTWNSCISRFLIDHKYYGQTGEREASCPSLRPWSALFPAACAIPSTWKFWKRCAKCQILIALGTCATNGGIPAMINMDKLEDIQDLCSRVRQRPNPGRSSRTSMCRSAWIRVYALDEFVQIDISLPGCPPHPDWITAAVLALLDGKRHQAARAFRLRHLSDQRERKKGMGDMKRILSDAGI
jgi:F420-non-reducing hydrogenase small subunit